MAEYRIENNEILISFDSIPPIVVRNDMKSQGFRWDPGRGIWHADFSNPREELARRICPSNPIEPNEPTSQPPLTKDATLDEKLERLLSTNDEAEKTDLNNALSLGIKSDIDTYVQAIRDYKKIEDDAASEKKTLEAPIKDALEVIAARKKLASDKRNYLEQIIVNYMHDTGEEKLEGSLFNVSFKEESKYSISNELEEEIRQRANLPIWISMELKVNQKAIRELAEIPDGAIATSNYKLQSWTEQEGDPNVPSFIVSLNAFLNGASISEIADRRNLRWDTVKSHLMKAIDEGELNIHQYVPDMILNQLDNLRERGADWSISDYRNAINCAVSYDWVSLALSFLNIQGTE